jgi:YfiH family protein
LSPSLLVPDLLVPEWPAPAHVAALVSTRAGGVGAAPFDTLNLAMHVGDDPVVVAANRRLLQEAAPGLGAIAWLEQVHGTEVVRADAARVPAADALFSRDAALGCAVLTADCLPVLFCDRAGTQVAAAHAGWRGLCGGILERTAATFADPSAVIAWMGPAIGSRHFEVGPEVREQFLAVAPVQQRNATEACFAPGGRPGHFYADIYGLGRLRLAAAGVTAVFGGGYCAFADEDRWFSYRRAAVTGRMASLIYLMQNDSG